MMNQEVSIMLLTHKSKDLVLNYIKDIYEKFKIIIIDNSNDIELKKIIKKNYPLVNMHIIKNDGYGVAINYGSKFVDTKYFLISNPDIKGIKGENIKIFVESAKKLHNKFCVLGPRYLDVNPKTLKQSKYDKDISEMRFLSGACMFFDKKKFDLIGGFDENIFLYFEENDFCKRSIKYDKNYQINNIKVYHDAGNSVSLKNDIEIEDQRNLRSWHFVWSKFYYYKKNYNYIFAIFFFIPIIARTGSKIIYYLFKKNQTNYLKYKNRWSGMISSIKGEKSFKRPKF